VKKKFPILDLRLPVDPASVRASFFQIANRKSQIANGFTLIEVMVVMALLSLIVIALMGVFNTTQAAFRASVTQTDVLEGGRAAMDLISGDLRAMSPSGGVSNSTPAYLNNGQIPVNFYVSVNNASAPLVQSLIASGSTRTNVVESFFLLSRNNQTLTGVGYYVDTASTSGINPLYRFSMSTNVSAVNGAARLYYNFQNTPLTNSPPWSHLLDGVVGFRLRAYDPNGIWLTNGFVGVTNTLSNASFFHSTLGKTLGEAEFYMFSNALPASVEIEMATLEDRTLQRAETWPNGSPAQLNYLAGQAGKLHVFRQRVTIPNVDPAAYQ
jgi:prepilin-type N-terminal cleavage/methylation domain-containing protein